MPVHIKKLPSGKFQVSTPNQVHAKGTTLEKAKSQERLLNAIEHNPEFIPRDARKRVHHSPPVTEVDHTKIGSVCEYNPLNPEVCKGDY